MNNEEQTIKLSELKQYLTDNLKLINYGNQHYGYTIELYIEDTLISEVTLDL